MYNTHSLSRSIPFPTWHEAKREGLERRQQGAAAQWVVSYIIYGGIHVIMCGACRYDNSQNKETNKQSGMWGARDRLGGVGLWGGCEYQLSRGGSLEVWPNNNGPTEDDRDCPTH